MQLETYIVNAFTENLAEGNPAGVVFCNDDLSDELLLKLAIDIGKSETAFIRKITDDSYAIRWFSPRKEMPLCGHATLAAAKAVFEKASQNELTFISPFDELKVMENGAGKISMKFPLDTYRLIDVEEAYHRFFPGAEFDECIMGIRTKKVVLVLNGTIELESIVPDYDMMADMRGIFENGIGLTKKSKIYDFESRYFNPWAGVNEDPITGSVHTVLARYWEERLGKKRMVARQASFRPGTLELENESEFVNISGKARIVLRGLMEI